MANPVEIVISAVDNASGVFQNIRTSGQEAGDRIANSMDEASESVDKINDNADKAERTMEGFFQTVDEYANKAALAVSGAGVALEGLAQKSKGNTEMTQRLAHVTGMTTDEMRTLALETTNVTFPLEDVVDIMMTATQQGIKGAEELQNYAWFWDTVGDAADESGSELAKAGIALRGIGIAAGEEEEALNSFGFILENTTSSVGEFITFIERTGPQLRDMGLDINDTAAILGAMEQELGMSGRMARQEFRKAVNEMERSKESYSKAQEKVAKLSAEMQTSGKVTDAMKKKYAEAQQELRLAENGVMDLEKALGLSSGTVAKYRQEVENSGDKIDEYADIHAESYTSMDKFKQKMEEITYAFGDQIQFASQFTTILIGAGPVIKGATMAMKGFAAAQTVALGPIALVIAAIAAVIAIVYLLIKHWDKVKEFAISAWEKIVSVFGISQEQIEEIWNKIKAGAEKAWEFIKKGAEFAFKALTIHWRLMYMGVKAGIEWIMKVGPTVWDGIKNAGAKALDFIKSYWSTLGSFFKGLWSGIMNGVKAPINFMISGANTLIGALNRINIKVPDWVPGIGGKGINFNIPTIPRLHTGGIFRAPKGQGEGLALLKDGEKVIDPMTTRKQARSQESGKTQVIQFILDGNVITEVVANTIMEKVEVRGG